MQAEVDYHRNALSLVRDLHRPRPAIYWIDLTLTAIAGWGSFGVVLMARYLTIPIAAAIVVAALSLYRGLCFVHEISHLRKRCLPAFETVWNLMFGFPLL